MKGDSLDSKHLKAGRLLITSHITILVMSLVKYTKGLSLDPLNKRNTDFARRSEIRDKKKNWQALIILMLKKGPMLFPFAGLYHSHAYLYLSIEAASHN